jgi:F-type H+-transporting ATPase subunit epsilon
VAQRLEVHVVTPQRVVWSGEASIVVARGTEGELGIQRGHAPLLVRLDIGVLRIRQGGTEVRAAVDGGFLHVTTSEDLTRVDVLADEAQLDREIDPAAAERALREAERRLESATEEADAEAARRALKRAEARLALRGA